MPRDGSASVETMPINDICDRYPDEWVLIKILDSAMPMGDAPGQVLAHGKDRKRMSKELLKAHKREPTAVTTIIHGGTRFGDGDALRRALARIAAEEEFVSVNPW